MKHLNQYILESKKKYDQYQVYFNGQLDKTFTENSKKWKSSPKVGQGWYCGGTVFKIVKIEDNKVYTEEDKNCHP